MTTFFVDVNKLKRRARDTFLGVRYHCFEAAKDMEELEDMELEESCDHEPPVTKRDG